MNIAFDETGFSFTSIVTGLDAPRDVSINMGLGSAPQVPIPGAVLLFGLGILALAGIKIRKK